MAPLSKFPGAVRFCPWGVVLAFRESDTDSGCAMVVVVVVVVVAEAAAVVVVVVVVAEAAAAVVVVVAEAAAAAVVVVVGPAAGPAPLAVDALEEEAEEAAPCQTEPQNHV
jgi:hypothetical protein